jgi:uncharacterized protein
MIFSWILKKIVLALIRGYQISLSPDHGWFKSLYPYGFCKFHPTCSQYAYEAIEKFGVVKGSWVGFKRIIKCNPWSEPRVDSLAQ